MTMNVLNLFLTNSNTCCKIWHH